VLTASARNWQGRSDQHANCRRIWSHAATTARLLGSNLDSGGPTCTCHRRDSKGGEIRASTRGHFSDDADNLR
jgi:hypothetical protein